MRKEGDAECQKKRSRNSGKSSAQFAVSLACSHYFSTLKLSLNLTATIPDRVVKFCHSKISDFYSVTCLVMTHHDALQRSELGSNAKDTGEGRIPAITDHVKMEFARKM